MFYDLNIPWTPTDPHLPRTLAFLDDLGYSVVALNHTISGKLPAILTSAIPDPPLPPKDLPRNRLEIKRRVTLVLTETYQNARLAELARAYDVLAVRPIDERSFQLACGSLDCDVISLDLTQRLPFFFKFKTLSEAVRSGKKLEICYSQALLGDSTARRNLISNATQLIRASRGRGLLISSEAKTALGCRGPWDVVNLAAVWGLGQERGVEAVSREARSVVVMARMKREGYRGVVDVVFGGEKPAGLVGEEKKNGEGKKGPGKVDVAGNGQKRKADVLGEEGAADGAEKPVSKREAKRRARVARDAAQNDSSIEAAKAGADTEALEKG
ncbi:hypothetical protein B0A50_04089 [Salinomyces thailandicus]|uniref:Uncharacterized protein n=1 Tax=Salinomyces thailandicus TaxID=706561 RepID=A0A4U0U023_9PEZI|nr:hypothetical protein B0A50_04089 [Salinomyces thailandica]